MRKLLIGAVATALAAVLVSPGTATAVDEINTKKLRDAVTVNGILQHERAFQRIANNNGGTRASGTPGYDASAELRVPSSCAPPATRCGCRSSPSRSSAIWPAATVEQVSPDPDGLRDRERSSTPAAVT